MQDNKFTFSPGELRLMNNKDFFIEKNIITRKIIAVFNELNERIEIIKVENKDVLPPEALMIAGKISKGENYLGLPYMIEDNPRLFHKADVFAFRSMFWWGNYFSFTFHLSGEYLENYRENILKNLKQLKGNNFLICINNEQWLHHLENENYHLLDDFSKKNIEQLVTKNKFLKLSRKLDIKNWEKVVEFGADTFTEYVRLIKS